MACACLQVCSTTTSVWKACNWAQADGKKKMGWDGNETKLPASEWLSMDHREFVYKRTNCWCVSLHFQFFAHSVSSALSFDLDCFLWYYCSPPPPPLSLLPSPTGNHFLYFLGCPRMTHIIVLFKLVSLQTWISKSLSKLNHEMNESTKSQQVLVSLQIAILSSLKNEAQDATKAQNPDTKHRPFTWIL